MPATCVRQTELPNTSALFADVLYRPDRTASFYGHERHDLEAVRAAAQKIEFSNEKRAALVAALRPQNPASPALDRLAQPGTVAVVTGQQVGLFSGPAYTIYKALTAVRLAEALTARGTPAVPLFWLATEDHDFAEASHAWIFDSSYRPARLEVKAETASRSRPCGDIVLAEPPIKELRSALRGLPHADEVIAAVSETYPRGVT